MTLKHGQKNHICQCGNDGEFFVSIPRTLKISLHQKFNCYQKILGSSIFMAEFTGLLTIGVLMVAQIAEVITNGLMIPMAVI